MGAAEKLTTKEMQELNNTYWTRFLNASQAVAKKQALWRILDIYDRGDQWKDANIPPWVAKPVTNYIRYVRTLKRANLTANIPTVQVTPLEKDFEEFIARLHKAYKHVWKWEKVDRTVRWSVDRGLLRGTSVVYVYDDPNYVGGKYSEKKGSKNRLYQGKICVKPWNILRWYIDPDATCIPEAKYIDCTEVLPLRSVKRNNKYKTYCQDNGTIKKLKELTGDQLGHMDTEDGTQLPREYHVDNTQVASDDDYMATVHIHWERYMNEDGRMQLDCTHYLRGTDFQLWRKEDIKPNCYPFAAYIDEQEDSQFHGSPTLGDSLENQRVLNKVDQTYSIIGTMHQNPQKVVTRSSGISAQEVGMAGTIPGKTWTTNDIDPAKSIHWTQPPDIPKGLFEVSNAMKQDIREMNGINEAYTGESVGSLTTSTGVRSLIDRASVRDRDKMKQIDAFVEDISDLIMKMILYKWQDERSISDRNADGSVSYETYKPIDEDIADQLEWMCTCDTYAIAPATQESRKQDAKDLMDAQGRYGFSPAIITPEEFIKMGGYTDGELILARMRKDNEMMVKQKQAQPPKIVPMGDFNISLNTKDPQTVYDTLGQMLIAQQIQQANQLQLEAEHLGNGLNVNPQQQQGQGMGAPAEQQAQAPSGTADGQAMAAMTAGQ